MNTDIKLKETQHRSPDTDDIYVYIQLMICCYDKTVNVKSRKCLKRGQHQIFAE